MIFHRAKQAKYSGLVLNQLVLHKTSSTDAV